MFGEELRPLRESAHLRPVPAEDVNSPEVVERMAELSPYLLVVLCGGRPGQPLLREVCGLSIRVHEGWCPEYRGTNAVEWALYHRDIRRIGSTVHIIREGPNRGPILRRASACLTAFDTAPSCRARVAALGAAILRDAVEEILQEDEITVYDQPAGAGRTSRPADMTEWIRQAIHRDLGKGMLARELQRQRSF